MSDIKNTVISMESKVDGLANRVREVENVMLKKNKKYKRKKDESVAIEFNSSEQREITSDVTEEKNSFVELLKSSITYDTNNYFEQCLTSKQKYKC